MKLLIPFLSLIFGFISFAQNDTLFVNNGAHWDVRGTRLDDETLEIVPAPGLYYEAYIDNDSILIDGKIWQTVRNGDYDPVAQIAIDSGRVYFQSFDADYPRYGTGTEPFVLYDFNKEVGDTVFWIEEYPVTLLDITTTDILGEEKTMFTLDNGDEWVYGMGSIHGLYRPLFVPFEWAFHLCSFDGNYINESGEEYSYAVYSESTCMMNLREEETIALSVFPNPASNRITILSDNVLAFPYSLEDLSGNVVLSGEAGGGQIELLIDHLANGVYLFRMADLVERIVIHH